MKTDRDALLDRLLGKVVRLPTVVVPLADEDGEWIDTFIAVRRSDVIALLKEASAPAAEPTGLGAVVEADDNRAEKAGQRTRWVKFRAHGSMALPDWCTEDGARSDYWRDLKNPLVLSEGWHFNEDSDED